jgi:hypothetical protein
MTLFRIECFDLDQTAHDPGKRVAPAWLQSTDPPFPQKGAGMQLRAAGLTGIKGSLSSRMPSLSRQVVIGFRRGE